MNFKNLKYIILDKLHITAYWRRRRKYPNIGEHTYVIRNTKIDRNVKVGKFCSIADCCYIGAANHPLTNLTTSPISYSGDFIKKIGNINIKPEYRRYETKSNNSTIIGNDVMDWVQSNNFIGGECR